VARLLVLTPADLTRDPRARRAALTAQANGFDVVGLSGGAVDGTLPGIEVVGVRGDRVSGALRSAGLGGMRSQRPFVRELRGLYRLVRLAAVTARLARAGRRLGRFDVVHANDLDTLPAAGLLARRTGARLVYDAHEVYTAQEPDPPRLHRAVARALEGLFARRADTVTTVSEPIADELRSLLRLERRPIAVLNCPPVDARGAGTPDAPPPLRAIYQGAMGPGRRVEDLLDAAAEAPSVHLTLRVVGLDSEALQAEIDRRGLSERVGLAAPVGPEELVEALRPFHVGLIINRPVTRNDELVFPNKLFEYLMAGLAVVTPALPGLEPLVDGEQVGATFAPGDAADFARALEALAHDPARLAEARANARRIAVDRFNAEAQTASLLAAWGC
jgi:glycosyltransferase involved in cell wall biosynthesis